MDSSDSELPISSKQVNKSFKSKCKQMEYQSQPIKTEQRLQRMKPFWNKYFHSFPPSKLDLQESFLHKVIWLFMEVSRQPFFLKLYRLNLHQMKNAESQIVEAIVVYTELLKTLVQATDYDQRADVLYEVFSSMDTKAADIINAFALIIHQTAVQDFPYDFPNCDKQIFITIHQFPQANIGEIRGQLVDGFISFKGIIKKVVSPKLMVISMRFQCFQCKNKFICYFADGVYIPPEKCSYEGKKECKGKIFVPDKDSVAAIPIQRIYVEQLSSEGRLARSICCEFRNKFVGNFSNGNHVVVAGILKADVAQQLQQIKNNIFSPYVLVSSIEELQSNVKKFDKQTIEKMKNDKQIFFNLVKSFCPSIFGHQLIKAGLLLGLVGGSDMALKQYKRDQQISNNFRQTCHILILGDPGLGKTQLLKFATQILPNSRFTCGSTVTTSGLTVSISKQGGDQSIETGVLVLSNNGICAIDQFDKVQQVQALLQVMQQQSISIAKNGIICQFKCNTAVFASANPINGSYNRSKTFKQNTKIPNALLSRFDLIFISVDHSDAERDKRLSRHILSIHTGNRKKNKAAKTFEEKQMEQFNMYESLKDKISKQSQKNQLMYQIGEIRQYVAYVKANVHPTLSPVAAEVIKGFFLTLRDHNPTKSFEINNRHLESLIRLSMARARLECRTLVTEEDAIDATNLMQQSLFDAYQEMGMNTNFLRAHDARNNKVKLNKPPGQLSRPKKKAFYIEKLREKTEEKANSLWTYEQLITLSKDSDLNISDFRTFIEELNYQGMLLSKGNKLYVFQDCQ